jgi:hypothetical protein
VAPDSEWSGDLAVVAVDTGDARPLPWAADGAEEGPIRLGTAVFALAVGDLIATAGGREVRDADELHEVLDSLGEEGTLQLALVRGTDELTVIVAFGSGSEQVGSV